MSETLNELQMPEYLQEQTEEKIRQRMLDKIPDEIDKSEGSYIWDAISPVAIEFAQAAIEAQQLLKLGFAHSAYGEYLDYRCEEHGIKRKEAQKARGEVKIIGKLGIKVAAGTEVTTKADFAYNLPIIKFVTLEEVGLNNLESGVTDQEQIGSAVVKIAAVEAGSNGNVPANAITVISLNGLTVTNEKPTFGGIEREDDEALRERFRRMVYSTSTSGNKADYLNWALEVDGVGGAMVIPVKDGPGTVGIALVNQKREAAEELLVERVQEVIAPLIKVGFSAKDLEKEGTGVVVDGELVKLTTQVGARLRKPIVTNLLERQAILSRAGIWQARISLKVDANQKKDNLIELGVWNNSTNAWAKSNVFGGSEARQVLNASQLGLDFQERIIEFYWNGEDQQELRLTRVAGDQTTIVWVKAVLFQAVFTEGGKAPLGARVKVYPAQVRKILLKIVGLKLGSGYTVSQIKGVMHERIDKFLKEQVFKSTELYYNKFLSLVTETPGVVDFMELTINNLKENIKLLEDEVPVLEEIKVE